MKDCICRTCKKIYEEDKSRAELKGYCSQKCMHEKSREFGFRKEKKGEWTEYETLRRHNEVGSVFTDGYTSSSAKFKFCKGCVTMRLFKGGECIVCHKEE